jgi:hypothetical protein
MLILKNNRPDFKSLFIEHLNKVRVSYSSYNPYCYGYDGWGYDDDDYYSDLFHGHGGTLFGDDDDDDDEYYDGILNGYRNRFSVGGGHKRKRGSRGGSNKKLSNKRPKCVPLYLYGDDDDDDVVYPLKDGKKSKSKSSSKKARYSDNEDNLFSRSDDDKMIYYYSDMNNPDDNVSIFYSVFDFDKFLDEEGVYVNESDIQSLLSRSISHCCINPCVDDRLELMTDSSFGGLHYQYAENNDELLAAENKLVHSSSVNR